MSNNSGIMHKSAEITQALSSIDWTPPEKGSYSENFVIEAFLKGKEVGEKQHEKILMDKFFANLNLTGKATEELVKEITGLGFSVLDIRLNPFDITAFDVLLMVREKDHLNDDFLKTYSKARAIKEKYNSDTLYISFSFMPHSTNLNESCLSSDGYSWKYAKLKGKTRARTA